LTDIDFVISIIFVLELFIKIISYGFLFNGEHSYLRNNWNILDFFIVIISIITVNPTYN
jgi:hypothetical protein